jgi:hypothetical protein
MVKIILYLSKTVTMLSFIIAPASNVAMSWSLIPIPFAMSFSISCLFQIFGVKKRIRFLAFPGSVHWVES